METRAASTLSAVAGRPRSAARIAPLACGCAVAAAAVYVAANDPAGAGSRFPQCPFRELTGLWCPGCGLTRGVHALLRGDVAGAVASNLFTPVVVVVLIAAWWAWVRRAFVGPPARAALARVSVWCWVTLGAVVVAYGVLRNVPALSALAP